MTGTESLLQALLTFVWAPLLVAAGVLDWTCHRQLRIEHTAGLKESLLHLLMISLVGAALLGALFLSPTADLFAAVLMLLALHEACYAADLNVALDHRPTPPLEQWVHGFQHLLPWVGAAGWMALTPGQARALLQLPGEAPDWLLRLRPEPLPWPYTAGLLAAALLFNVLPFLAEARRCARARRLQRAR